MPLIGWFYDELAPHEGQWVIFGAGALGITAHAQIARAGGKVITYIDNAIEKQGNSLLGAPIAPASKLPDLLRPGVNLVIAGNQYPEIILQLSGYAIDHLWVGIMDNPLDIPEKLGLDNRDDFKGDIVVYLPEEKLNQAVWDNYLADLARVLERPIATLRFSAPLGWESAYAELGLPGKLPTQDIWRDAKLFQSIVFFRGAYHADQWAWSPYGLTLLTPRIYVLQPWGQLRCTNRVVTHHEHRQIARQPFFRNTTHDNQSFLAFAPHIQLARDESFGTADAFGFRHPAWNKPDGCGEPINICLFGGSAAWGQGLPDQETLAWQLQQKLNSCPLPGDRHFRVYNFAQPAATVVGEIIAFLLYAATVTPQIVIAHDGFNDLYYGQLNDRYILRSARYAYHPMLERWGSLLHGSPSAKHDDRLPPSPEQIVDAYTFRRDQFAQVTRAFGCQHIHGLQPYLDSRHSGYGPRETDYRRSALYGTPENRNMRKLYDLIKDELPDKQKIDFDQLFRTIIDAQDYFFDIVHPTPRGNSRMAEHYAKQILAMMIGPDD